MTKVFAYTELSSTDSKNEIEMEIVEKGLNIAPRVTNDQINELMSTVRFDVHQIPDTTTIIVTAITADGFSLAHELSACVSKENFDFEFGKKLAIDKASTAARNKLWELEGYRLKYSGVNGG